MPPILPPSPDTLNPASAKFAMQFNKLLAGTGKSANVVTQGQMDAPFDPVLMQKAAGILNSVKTPKVPKFKIPKGPSTLTPTVPLNQDLLTTVENSQGSNPTAVNPIKPVKSDSGWLGSVAGIFKNLGEDIGDAFHGNFSNISRDITHTDKPAAQLLSKIMQSPGVKKPLELISRIGYTVTGAETEVAKAVAKGEPIWSLGDNAARGAWRGLSGQDKNGYGVGIEALQRADAANNGAPPRALQEIVPSWFPGHNMAREILNGPKALNDLKAVNPTAEKWAKRFIAGTADAGSDLTTYVGGGAIDKLAGGLKLATKTAEYAGDTAKAAKGIDAVDIAVRHSTETALKETGLIDKLDAKISNIDLGTFDPAKPGIFPSSSVTSKAKSLASDTVIRDTAQQVADSITEIHGGAQAGKTTRLTNVSNAEQAAAFATQHVGEQLVKPIEDKIARLESGLMSKSEKMGHYADDPMFKAYTDAKSAHMDSGVSLIKAKELAMGNVLKFHEPDLMAFHTVMLKTMKDTIEHVPTLRFLGKDIAEFPTLGKGFKMLSEASRGDAAFGKSSDALRRVFSYSANVTGELPNIAVFAKGHEYTAWDNLHKVLDEAAVTHGIGEAELKIMNEARHTGTQLTGPVGQMQTVIDKAYGTLRTDLLENGVIDVPKFNKLTRDNYEHIQYIGKENKGKIKFLKDLQKGYINTIGDAVALGHKVEENPINNLLYYSIKSNNQMAQRAILRDVWSLYGTRGVFSPNFAEKMNLIEFNPKNFGTLAEEVTAGSHPDILKYALKPGEGLYLHKDIADSLKNLKDLMNFSNNSDSGRDFVKALDYVTKRFKTMNTIYFPGFHIKNILSDMIIGSFDGIGVKDIEMLLKH